MEQLIDTHCHVHEALLRTRDGAATRAAEDGVGAATRAAEDGVEEADEGDDDDDDDVEAVESGALDACVAGVGRVVTMGTRPADWAAVAALRRRYGSGKVCPAFGVHPWHAFRVSAPPPGGPEARWCTALRQRLAEHPDAVVGEIGLDKVAKVPGSATADHARNFLHQIAVFRWQLGLAAELRRPVSVHCVHAAGPLLDALQHARPLPPTVAMHSYTGSVDTVHALVRLGGATTVFFGFSACICLRSPDKARAAIAAVPADRLLLESDHADPRHVLTDLATILNVVCEVKGWTPSEALARTTANAHRWLRPSHIS